MVLSSFVREGELTELHQVVHISRSARCRDTSVRPAAAAAGWLTSHQYSCGSESPAFNAVLEAGLCCSLIRPLWITWAVGRYRVGVTISGGSAVEKGSCFAGQPALTAPLSSVGHFQLRVSFPHLPKCPSLS